jgi:hypothetical protein
VRYENNNTKIKPNRTIGVSILLCAIIKVMYLKL